MEELQLNRRRFLKNTFAGAALAALGLGTESAFAKDDHVKLTILHTNDVHSRIDPFPQDDPRYAGKGGVAPRAALIRKIREEEDHVLLLDAGDIFQGTPYFNFYGGELELKMMTMMGYDAAIMGNHDFDNGVEGFAKQLHHAGFPILNANYDFSDTELNGRTGSYRIFKKGGIRIGVFGLGIELTGLVNKAQSGNTVYLDPIAKAVEMENLLKKEHKCDMIICLSHLGYSYKDRKISDMVLAQNTNHINLIIGGHTHTFLDRPTVVKNLRNTVTLVNQVGFAGINLGRVDFVFDRSNPGKIAYTSALQEVSRYFTI